MGTNGKRNRTAGHRWERKIVSYLKLIGYIFAVTTRSESRSRDDKKIDIMNYDEATNGRLPFNIQCKSTTVSVPYGKILTEMPDEGLINVIFHEQTRNVNGRFMCIGEYAILNLSDLLEIFEFLKQNNYERRTSGT